MEFITDIKANEHLVLIHDNINQLFITLIKKYHNYK